VYIKSNNKAAVMWDMIFTSFRDIKGIYDLCGEFLLSKKSGFEKHIRYHKRDCLGGNMRISHFLVNAIEIEKVKGYFTSKDFIGETRRKSKITINDIGYLSGRKLIKLVGKEGYFKTWKVTKKGKNYLKGIGIKNKQRWIELFE